MSLLAAYSPTGKSSYGWMRSILESRGEQLAENIGDLGREPAVHDKRALMSRVVKADIVEADRDKIVERRRDSPHARIGPSSSPFGRA